MDARRHQIVHQVVARRDRGKNLAHEARLFLRRHIAIAEGDSLILFAHEGSDPVSDIRISRSDYNVFSSLLADAMPELPEVETVRLGLAPALEGHVLKELTARRG